MFREEEEEDPSVPLLGEQREEGEPSASGGAPVSSLPQLERRPSKPLSPAPSSSRRRERCAGVSGFVVESFCAWSCICLVQIYLHHCFMRHIQQQEQRRRRANVSWQ